MSYNIDKVAKMWYYISFGYGQDDLVLFANDHNMI